MSSDPRDTNRDGKVSLTEKVKDKLHLGHKNKDAYTTTTTHASTGTTFDARDRNHDGHVSMGEKLKGADLNRDGHVSTGERLAGSSMAGGAFMDRRDLNHDGHISTSERLIGQEEEARMRLHEEQLALGKQKVSAGEVGLKKHIETEVVHEQVPVKREEVIVERRPLSGAPDPKARIAAEGEVIRVPLYKEEVIAQKQVVPKEEIVVRKKEVIGQDTVTATLRSEFAEEFESTAHSTTSGAFDARDTNLDGHVSMGEKLKGAFGSHKAGAFDARDTNRDGHVSMGEKLKADTFGTKSTAGAFDSRDLNRDGHVSMGEKLGAGAVGAAPATKAARG